MRSPLLGTIAALAAGTATADPVVFNFNGNYTAFRNVTQRLFAGKQVTFVQFCPAAIHSQITSPPNSTVSTVPIFQITSILQDTLGNDLTSVTQIVPTRDPLGFTGINTPANYVPTDYQGAGKTLLTVPCTTTTNGSVSSGTPLSIVADPNAVKINTNSDYAAYKSIGQTLGGTTFFSTNCPVNPSFSATTITGESPIITRFAATSQPSSFTADFPNATQVDCSAGVLTIN